MDLSAIFHRRTAVFHWDLHFSKKGLACRYLAHVYIEKLWESSVVECRNSSVKYFLRLYSENQHIKVTQAYL